MLLCMLLRGENLILKPCEKKQKQIAKHFYKTFKYCKYENLSNSLMHKYSQQNHGTYAQKTIFERDNFSRVNRAGFLYLFYIHIYLHITL